MCHGSCFAPRKPACWPGQIERAFHQERRQRDAGRHAVGPRVAVIERRRVARPVVARGDLVELAAGDRRARQHVMRRQQMVVFAMGQRANEGTAMHPLGQPRQVFADLQARHRRRDRLELAANLGRRVRLHVERVVMARRPGEKDDDDRLGFAWLRRSPHSPCAATRRPNSVPVPRSNPFGRIRGGRAICRENREGA